MKVFIVLALISISSAAKLRFEPFSNEFSDCGGSRIRIDTLSVDPDPVPVPGQATVNAAGEVTADLTGDGLKMAIKLTKVKPTHLDVPCVDGLGSCTYDVCTELIYPDAPLPANKLALENLVVDLPDQSWAVDLILNG